MKKPDKKGVVFSTNPDFKFDIEEELRATLPPAFQQLYVSNDRKMRAGKTVTLVEGFSGSDDDLEQLGKTLRQKCGAGGSAKDGVIIVQGEFRDRVYDWLMQQGYGVKKKGG